MASPVGDSVLASRARQGDVLAAVELANRYGLRHIDDLIPVVARGETIGVAALDACADALALIARTGGAGCPGGGSS